MKTTKSQGHEHSRHFAATQAEKVYTYIQANPNQTREEISIGTGLQKSSCTARIKSLIDDGMIHVSGTKPGKHGVLNETLSALPATSTPKNQKTKTMKVSIDVLNEMFNQIDALKKQLNQIYEK